MTKGPVFFDTSVILAAIVRTSPFHDPAKSYFDRVTREKATVWISRQVLREYMAVQTRPQPYAGPVPGPVVSEQVAGLLKVFKVADEDERCTRFLLGYVDDGRAAGRQVHDAAIVAAMQVHGIRRLATLNEAHFRRFVPEIQLEKVSFA